MEKETIIELKNIRKEFPGVVALDNVNMKIRASEVHALVGENGAGKSTLMKILSGTYSNYGGSVICKGEEIHMKCEKDAFKYGISIVAQELNYVSELSIAENLFLGREPKKGKVFVNKAERLKETQRLLDEMGLDYNPREKMGNLNVAQRQMIEILKSITRDSRVIIMDEWSISVEEVMRITKKSRDFILNAIEQGVMPGSVVKHDSGKRSTYIPRKAFMDYMNNYYRAPSDKLIAAVVEELTKRKTIE